LAQAVNGLGNLQKLEMAERLCLETNAISREAYY